MEKIFNRNPDLRQEGVSAGANFVLAGQARALCLWAKVNKLQLSVNELVSRQ